MSIYKNIETAIYKRESLFRQTITNAFRLINGQGDGCYGLILDYYNDYLLLQVYDSSLYQEYHRISDHCIKILACCNRAINGVLLKDRSKVHDPQQITELRKSVCITGAMPPVPLIVKQNDIVAGVDLINGQNTGLFLDMRGVRQRLATYYAKGGKLCNLFSYTALFAVHALKNGLHHAVNVDMSKSVLQRAKQNYMLNQIGYDNRDFVAMDCKKFLKYAAKHNDTFHFVIFDPPTFSRNKGHNFSVKKHYNEFLMLIAPIVSDGYVLTTINTITISDDEYISLHPGNWDLQFLEHEPDDFPYYKEPYLKAGLWKMR